MASRYRFANGVDLVTGTGSPESAVTANVGSLYLDASSGDLYTKTSGTGATGWTAAGGGGGGSATPNFIKRTINAWYPAFVSGTPSSDQIGTSVTVANAGTRTAVVAGGHLVTDYASAATSGNVAGFRSSQFLIFDPTLNPDFTAIVRAPSTMTDVRVWVGLTSTSFTNSDTNGGSCAAFRYSTVAGDSGWTPITRDGTTQNVGTAIGSTPTADAFYKLRIRTTDGGTTWKFSVDGSTEQDVTTNVPGSSATLGWHAAVIPQVNAVRNLGFVRIQADFGKEVS